MARHRPPDLRGLGAHRAVPATPLPDPSAKGTVDRAEVPYIRTVRPPVLLRAARRHWLLSLVLVAGVVLRVLTWFAYQPALLYIDTFRYLENLVELSPDQLNPIGYSVILSPLLLGVNLSTVAAVQHALGVGIALALYVLALRHGVSRWLAAVVAAVVLLDGSQLQIEQNILSEVWFQALLVGVLRSEERRVGNIGMSRLS